MDAAGSRTEDRRGETPSGGEDVETGGKETPRPRPAHSAPELLGAFAAIVAACNVGRARRGAELELYAQSAFGTVQEGEAAAVAADQSLNDGQAEADAAGIARSRGLQSVEGFGQLTECGLRDAGAVIVDLEEHEVWGDGQGYGGGAAAVTQDVVEQIDHDPGQRDRRDTRQNRSV